MEVCSHFVFWAMHLGQKAVWLKQLVGFPLDQPRAGSLFRLRNAKMRTDFHFGDPLVWHSRFEESIHCTEPHTIVPILLISANPESGKSSNLSGFRAPGDSCATFHFKRLAGGLDLPEFACAHENYLWGGGGEGRPWSKDPLVYFYKRCPDRFSGDSEFPTTFGGVPPSRKVFSLGSASFRGSDL